MMNRPRIPIFAVPDGGGVQKYPPPKKPLVIARLCEPAVPDGGVQKNETKEIHGSQAGKEKRAGKMR